MVLCGILMSMRLMERFFKKKKSYAESVQQEEPIDKTQLIKMFKMTQEQFKDVKKKTNITTIKAATKGL